MKQRVLSVALALCLLLSSQSMASAQQEVPLPQEEISSYQEGVPLPVEGSAPQEHALLQERVSFSTEDSMPQKGGSLPAEDSMPQEDGSLPAEDSMPQEDGSLPAEDSMPQKKDTLSQESISPSLGEDFLPQEDGSLEKATLSQEIPLPQEEVSADGSLSLQAADGAVPTPAEAYAAMIALKDQEAYKEGTTWTNDEPYSGSGYSWNGGLINGAHISAVGCVAFAFILSDAAFGNLPNRMYAAGEFAYDDIKAGDILRVNNDVHTVIVLEANEAGVVVAEGNISTGDHVGKVHWGRTISKEEVMRTTSHYITRYPEGYVPPTIPLPTIRLQAETSTEASPGI